MNRYSLVMTGFVVYFEWSLVVVKSSLQKRVALSVTEAELFAAVSCLQMMLFIKRLVESLKLKVKVPMIAHDL